MFASALTTSLITYKTPALAEENGLESLRETLSELEISNSSPNNLIEKENLYLALSPRDIEGTCWVYADGSGTSTIYFSQGGSYQNIVKGVSGTTTFDGSWRINNNIIEILVTNIMNQNSSGQVFNTYTVPSPTWKRLDFQRHRPC